jgi:hypothetical protein
VAGGAGQIFDLLLINAQMLAGGAAQILDYSNPWQGGTHITPMIAQSGSGFVFFFLFPRSKLKIEITSPILQSKSESCN